MGVVVKTAHQVVIHPVWNAHLIEQLHNGIEVFAAFLVEVVGHLRSVFHAFLIVVNLAVEQAQRILFITALAVGAQIIHIRGKVFLQGFAVSVSGFIVAKRI